MVFSLSLLRTDTAVETESEIQRSAGFIPIIRNVSLLDIVGSE